MSTEPKVAMKINIRKDQEREIRLLLAALEASGNKMNVSSLMESIIDDFFKKAAPKKGG